MANHHYQYFISLERDFEDSLQFIELDAINENCFSLAYLKMLFSACIETEAILKALIGATGGNINKWRPDILAKHPNFHQIKVSIPRYSMDIQPWASWATNTNPAWWRAYNDTKHNRGMNFRKANQAHTIEAIAGLFASLVYLIKDTGASLSNESRPKLFNYPNLFPHTLVFSDSLLVP